MNTPLPQSPENLQDCATCLREIPPSEAQSSEARDYVAGFYGLACYMQWQAQADGTAGQQQAGPAQTAAQPGRTQQQQG